MVCLFSSHIMEGREELIITLCVLSLFLAIPVKGLCPVLLPILRCVLFCFGGVLIGGVVKRWFFY